MYAVIETGGKQYYVSEGDVIRVEKLDAEVGATLTIKEVVAFSKNDELKVGTVSNMYDILGAMQEVSKVIKL